MNDKKKQQAERIQRYAHMIEQQTGKAVRPYRTDGYMNMMNRYGTSKDTTEHYKFAPEPDIPDDSLTLLYEGNGLFAKVIDAPAEEAIKHGFTLKDVSDQEVESFYQEALDELDWEEVAMTGIKWARLFGGAIAVMLINDGGGLEEPLNWKRIKSIDDIRVYDRSVIQPDYSTMFKYDPRDPFRTRGSRLGMPEFYHVNSRYGSFTVHESRCLVFQNGVLPENCSNTNYQLWGMPEYIRIHRAIRDSELAHGTAPKMLDRSVQPVYKMKDLSVLLATDEGESQVLKRLQVIDLARSFLSSLVIDSENEDYDFKSFQFTGVADVIDATCNYLSALTNIPQTILFGRSPAGMNSTGESDLENWYSYVQRIQKRMLKSNLRYLLSIIFQAGVRTREVDEVPKIKIEFNPLKTLSDSEQAELDSKKAATALVKAQTVQLYRDMEVIDSTEIRRSLADSDEFEIDTILDEYESEEDLMAIYEQQEAENPGLMPGMEQAGVEPLGLPSGSAVHGHGAHKQMPTEVDVEEHKTDPGTEGSAPANAPAATKLPQDMSEQEIEEITNQDEAPYGVGVLVVKDGKILCGFRHNDSGYGLICGPGGHGEKGETYEQSAIRETQEEFGITPKELIPIGIGPLEPESGLRSHIFLCTDFDGEVSCNNLEIVNPMFVTMEKLEMLEPSLFPPFADSLEILKDCLFNDNEDGGPGSGNHGHEGVVGQLGGSAPAGGKGSAPTKTKAETLSGIDKLKDAPRMKPKGAFKKTVFPDPYGNPDVDTSQLHAISIKPISVDKGKEEVVSLKSLTTLQIWTETRRLKGIANSCEDVDDMTPEGETEGLPIVIRHNGVLILRDGNHRATVAKMQGKKSIRANVIEWDDVKDEKWDSATAEDNTPVKEDGGPGSGNFGHKGVPGQVGGSAPSSKNGRPSKGVKSSKTSLGHDERSKANDTVKKLRSEISKCKEIQDNANPKAKDYDPKPFIEAGNRQRKIKAEVQSLLDEMPAGTLIEKKRVLYEKNDDGKWIATSSERSYDASRLIAQEVCGIGDTTDKYTARFIESTEDVVQIEDITLKSDATYREYAENLNGMAKKDLVKLAKKNPEFKELVDSIVMYTEGGYVEQRKAFESVSKNGLEGASAQTVGELVNGDLYTYRNLWKGQNLEESDANISEGMVTIAKAIEHSAPYDGELYRVAQDRNIFKSNGNFEPYIPPKVGDTITITAPTSFTSDLTVEQELSKQKNGDVIHYVLESGAKAVNVSELSRYKQKEFLSCGKFEVVRVDTTTNRTPVYLREGDEPSYALQKRGIKEDDWGQKYIDIYDTKVTIRYVGDAPIGSRDDADESGFVIDQEQFEDRMVLTEKNIPENIPGKHEKPLDFSSEYNTITSKETSTDGAPKGNDNAAGPHKRSHLSKADKEKYKKRIVGQKTSDGVTVTGFWDHAFDRVAQRNISMGQIEKMLQSSQVSPDKTHPNRNCYDVPGKRLILDKTTGEIVTIEWRKQNK